jgi:hypothetical protein
MIYTPEQHIVPVVPNPEQFAEWVRASLEQLGTRPSHYLIEEGVPGSKNRVSLFLKNPKNLKFHLASELQRQILTDAARKGVNLGPIRIHSLMASIDLRSEGHD